LSSAKRNHQQVKSLQASLLDSETQVSDLQKELGKSAALVTALQKQLQKKRRKNKAKKHKEKR
jgi:hypothetical protein